MPLGLDLSEYTAVPPPRVTGDRLRVGWIGRLVPVKNIPLLIDTMEATIQKSAGIEFHIAGDGEDRELLRQAAGRLGDRLIWHGWVMDIAPLLFRCDVLLQTSRNEGTPVTLIQGMAAARPFVSTAVGGVVDMVAGPELRSGSGARWFANGVLVEPDAAAISRVLLELGRDRKKIAAMGLQARVFASTRYRAEDLLQDMGSLYRELIRRKLPAHEFNSETSNSETSLIGMEEGQWK
jgi:glycosyltransferase involved in cell wall biosynthesis